MTRFQTWLGSPASTCGFGIADRLVLVAFPTGYLKRAALGLWSRRSYPDATREHLLLSLHILVDWYAVPCRDA
jgi:hypothetical protein